mgnify:CR=1 FL=1
MTPKVSIIVPIYNAGKFLEKCLDTLVNQTLKDIEIILVLDCPTDGSDRIAREYAEKDPRIRLIINEQNLILPSPISTAFIRIGSFLIHITLTVLTKNN